MTSWESRVLLGCGGTQPGVSSVAPDTGSATELLRLSPGSSVYSIDRTEHTLAVGTKSGQLCLVKTDDANVPPDCDASTGLTPPRRPAIVSACLMDDSTVVVADTSGACLLWAGDAPGTVPLELDADGRLVVSLLRITQGQVAGLCTDGQLIVWDTVTGDRTVDLSCPAPGPRGALVCLVQWTHAGALLYPAADGSLVSYQLDDGQLQAIPAHDGECYVVLPWLSQLVTVGMSDDQLRIWSSDWQHHRFDLPIPYGAVSGAILDLDLTGVLLISERGECRTFQIEEDTITPKLRVSGNGYRVAMGPNPQHLVAQQAQARSHRVSDLVTEVLSIMDSGKAQPMDPLHGDLCALGYPHVSCALRAEQANRSGDLLAELHAWHAMGDIVDSTDPRVSRSLVPWAQALATAWLMPKAADLCARIPIPDPHSHDAAMMEHIHACADAMSQHTWIACPDMDIPLLIHAAEVTATPFTGTWVVRQLPPLSCGTVILGARTIADKYDAVRTENGSELPPSSVEAVSILSGNGVVEEEVVRIGLTTNGPKLRVVLCVTNELGQTAVTPLIVFAASQGTEHDGLLRFYRNTLASAVTDAWLGTVHSAVLTALQRLITMDQAAKRRGGP